MKKSKFLLAMLMAGLMATSVAGLSACGPTNDGTSSTASSQESTMSSEDPSVENSSEGVSEETGSEDVSVENGSEEVSVETGSEDVSEETNSEDVSVENSSEGETSEDEVVEEPVITVQGNVEEVTIGWNDSYPVPTATAIDNKDGVLDVEIFCETTPGAYNNGVFKTNVLGKHMLTYYAIDSEDNETYYDIIINVTSSTYADNNNVTGYNNLANLDSEGTFKENFQNGWTSPLIEGAVLIDGVSVEAGANSISGNSLVVNYEERVGLDNRIFLNTLPIRSGQWTVSFDVKLISGKADEDFYFGYVKEGEIDSVDQKFPLNDMTVGQTKRITYKQVLTLDRTGRYYFHFFEYDQNMKAVLAFDNFEVSYATTPEYNAVVPTLDQVQNGFVYDWANNYMAITAGMPEEVSKISNATAKTAIQNATSGFNSSVMHLTGNGRHDLLVFEKSTNPHLFQVGWTYTFEIDYYAVATGQHFMLAFDGTANNNAFCTGPFATIGLGKATIKYTVGANDTALTFYSNNDIDVYLGNVKVTIEDPSTITTTTTSGTKAWLDLNCGAKGSQVATPAEVASCNGFAQDYTLKFATTSTAGTDNTYEMFRMNDMTSGSNYISTKLTVKYYIASDFVGEELYLRIDGAFMKISAKSGYNTFEYETTAPVDFVSFYVKEGTCGTIYAGSVDYVVTMKKA